MDRDVAQLVARVLWEHDVAGSNPVIPTKKEKMTLVVVFSFLFGVSMRTCFAKQNAGSHTEGITKRQRSYPVILTKKKKELMLLLLLFYTL